MERERVKENEKEETKPKPIETNTCPECGGKVIEDGSERVCEECGLVIDEDMIDHGPDWRAFNSTERSEKSRVGPSQTETKHKKVPTTMIDWRDKDARGNRISSEKQQTMHRLREWQSRLRTKDSTERNLQFALSEMDRMASSLGLPQNVREVAAVTYKSALRQDLIRGRSIEGVATAALYAACRLQDVPRSLEEVEKVARVEKKEIGRTYRYISKELGLEMEPVNPKQYIPRYTSELDLSETVEAEAKRIIDVSKDAGLLSGKSPTGFAAAAIYASALLCNEKRTQKEVAEVADVTEVTIRNRYQEQIKVLGLVEFEENDQETDL